MEVGRVFVAVKPDFSGFRQELRTGLAAAGSRAKVEVEVDIDRTSLARVAADIRNLKTVGGELGKAFKLGGAITGIVGLTGATVGLSSALSVAAGGAAALSPVLFAAGQGAGVVALATAGVGDALKASSKGAKEYGEALRALPAAARPFVEQLVGLKPKLNELRTIAAEGLFPALQAGLTSMSKTYLPIFKKGVEDTSLVLGNLVRKGADLATSGPFSKNMEALIRNNSRVLAGAGTAALSLVDAFVGISAAAIPLTNHLVDLAVRGTEQFNQKVKDARASGGLAAFFKEAKTALDTVFRTLGNLGSAIGGLFKAALPSGQQLLAAIQGITDKFSAWVNSREGQAQLRKFFENCRDFALGLLSAIDQIAPKIGAFAQNIAAAAAAVGRFADAHPGVVLVGLAIYGVVRAGLGLLAVVRTLEEVRLLLATPTGAGLSTGLINVGAAGVAAAVTFGTLKYNVNELKTKGFENGRFLDPASLALKTLGGWLGITGGKTKEQTDKQALLKQVTADASAAFNKFGLEQSSTGGAIRGTSVSIAAQRAALDSLKNATLGAFDADTNLRRAQLNLNEAQKEVTRLQREGKTKTDEYKTATLNLRDAQSGVVRAKDGFVSAINDQKNAIKGSKDATVQQVDGLIKMYQRLGIKPPKDLLDFMDDLRRKTLANKNHKFTITGEGIVKLAGEVRGTAGAGRAFNTGGPIPGVGNTDTVPAMLTPGEFVIRKPAVKAIGLANLHRMNQMATGGLVAPQRFAIGGLVMGQQATGGAQMARNLQRLHDIVFQSVVSSTKAAVQRAEAAAAAASAGGPGGGTKGGAGAIKSFIKSTDPLPYVWGGVGPRGYDCSGLTGEVLNRIQGHASFRRRFTTASNFRAVGFKPGSGGTYSIGVTPGKHMAGEYGGLKFEAASTKSGIKIGGAARSVGSFPVRFHLNRGGLVGDLNRLIRSGAIDLGGDIAGPRLAIGRRLPDRVSRHEPIGVFHNGGYVQRNQLALLERGERVLTAAQQRTQGGGLVINVDARGAGDPAAVEHAARRGAEVALRTAYQSRRVGMRR